MNPDDLERTSEANDPNSRAVGKFPYSLVKTFVPPSAWLYRQYHLWSLGVGCPTTTSASDISHNARSKAKQLVPLPSPATAPFLALLEQHHTIPPPPPPSSVSPTCPRPPRNRIAVAAWFGTRQPSTDRPALQPRVRGKVRKPGSHHTREGGRTQKREGPLLGLSLASGICMYPRCSCHTYYYVVMPTEAAALISCKAPNT